MKKGKYSWLYKGILNSYSQVFFSDNPWFAGLLMVVTFINPYAGLAGLFAVVLSNVLAFKLGYDRLAIAKGVYGFNSLLTALGLGVFFEQSFALFVVVVLASFLNLLVSLALQGVLGKYYLPFLSLPFLISIWVVVMATRSFEALAISDKGIYILNELYGVGGRSMVKLYEFSVSLPIPTIVKAYLSSLSAIFFQFNVLAGLLIAIGLFLYSRIAFTLSVLGFSSAWWFYQLLGIDMTIFVYNYIGFNYILTAIAIGGYFFVPSIASYLWAVFLTPLVALVTVSFYNILSVFQLPVYSLPFNIVVLLFMYAVKLRVYPSSVLSEVFIQRHSPEENLYTNMVSKSRFRYFYHTLIKLPFWGEWSVSQGHDGEYTHKEGYRHAWDFVILDKDGKQFKNNGDLLTDYYCYDKAVTAPADGTVSEVQDGIPDNQVGKENLVNNWGNTIVLKHGEFLYSKISHLKEQSVKVKKGDHVKAGDIIATCGNSGRSPYPHLHFQLQATPFIGSKTIDYPISHFISNTNNRSELKSFDKPGKDEVVSNVQVNSLLQKAFEFTAGQLLEIDVVQNGRVAKAKWEVVTDVFNQTYLWEEASQSSAYFMNDGTLFHFTHFEGDKKSLLYMGYLALYEVLLAAYSGVGVKSTIPVNQVFNKVSLYAHDFVAPFVNVAEAGFVLEYQMDHTALSVDKICLCSTVNTRIFHRNRTKYGFEVNVTEKGVEKIEVIMYKYV